MSKLGCFLLVLIVAFVAAWGLLVTTSEGRALLKTAQAQSATLLSTPQAQAALPYTPRQNETAFAVQGAPSVTASFINTVLCTPIPTDTPAVSPACGTGQALYDNGVKAGIDPVYALAFFWHESTLGRYGVAAHTLGIGNIKCTPGYACYQGFRAYGSWVEGYTDWYRLITAYIQGEIAGCPCTTVPQIVPVYAPPSENDTPGYIRTIT